jgi:hypothetical protein
MTLIIVDVFAVGLGVCLKPMGAWAHPYMCRMNGL